MEAKKNKVRWFAEVWRVFSNEMRCIFHDGGVLLFFVVLPLLYPLVYTIIYNPEVAVEIPIAVVDNSLSTESRELVRKATATQGVEVYAYCPNMSDAKELMAEHSIYGIMEIDKDYARDIAVGTPAHVTFYSDMSLLLRYRTFISTLTDLRIECIATITDEKMAAVGGSKGMPIETESHFLGASEQGFASAIIPGIVILILQQSMLLGIGMLGGTSRERRLRNGGIDPEAVAAGSMATVWGKSLAYISIYVPQALYNLCFIPVLFRLPYLGNPAEYLIFILPMLLATAFLGQCLHLFMRERETAFLLVVFSSIVFIFLSGLPWPRYAMNYFWIWVGNLLPSNWGIQGFVLMNSNSATLADVSDEYVALWVLTAVYMILASIVAHYINKPNTHHSCPE